MKWAGGNGNNFNAQKFMKFMPEKDLLGHIGMNISLLKIGPVSVGLVSVQLKEEVALKLSGHSVIHLSNLKRDGHTQDWKDSKTDVLGCI